MQHHLLRTYRAALQSVLLVMAVCWSAVLAFLRKSSPAHVHLSCCSLLPLIACLDACIMAIAATRTLAAEECSLRRSDVQGPSDRLSMDLSHPVSWVPAGSVQQPRRPLLHDKGLVSQQLQRTT